MGNMIRRYGPVVVMLAVLCSAAAAEEVLINGRPVETGRDVVLYGEDLEMGRLEFLLQDTRARKAEITLDGGRTWDEMRPDPGGFSFYAYPDADETFRPEFMLEFPDGSMQMHRPLVSVLFRLNKPDEAVLELLASLRERYEAENEIDFLDLISDRFPGRIEFEEGIRNDFLDYDRIRLFYRLESRTFNDAYTVAVWDVYWKKKHENASGTEFEREGVMTMYMGLEDGVWRVLAMEDNLIFGAEETSSVDLVAYESEMQALPAGPQGPYLRAVIHNTGGTATTEQFTLEYYYPDGLILDGVETVTESIPGNSSLIVDHPVANIFVGAILNLRINPARSQPEENYANNEVDYTQ